MAGNVGTQSLAVTIRVLMDEQVTAKEKWALVRKEMKVGLCNGLLLGSLCLPRHWRVSLAVPRHQRRITASAFPAV